MLTRAGRDASNIYYYYTTSTKFAGKRPLLSPILPVHLWKRWYEWESKTTPGLTNRPFYHSSAWWWLSRPWEMTNLLTAEPVVSDIHRRYLKIYLYCLEVIQCYGSGAIFVGNWVPWLPERLPSIERLDAAIVWYKRIQGSWQSRRPWMRWHSGERRCNR